MVYYSTTRSNQARLMSAVHFSLLDRQLRRTKGESHRIKILRSTIQIVSVQAAAIWVVTPQLQGGKVQGWTQDFS